MIDLLFYAFVAQVSFSAILVVIIGILEAYDQYRIRESFTHG